MRIRSFVFGLIVVSLVFVGGWTGLASAENLQPYVMARVEKDALPVVVEKTRAQLAENGFEIVGDYSPYVDAHLFIVTNDALKAHAARSANGGFGAIQRVSVTGTPGGVQVAFTGSRYMANAYRMASDLADVETALKKALGAERTFGSKKGLSPKKLRKYHYMFMMPYFDDVDELASYGSFEEAVGKIESGLANTRGGAKKVYRVDVPGKKEAVFGVALPLDEGIMKIVDGTADRHTAHLCYELLVSGKKVVALKGKFRIALSFPDLTMGTFMKISSAPSDIMWALRDVALDRKKQ